MVRDMPQAERAVFESSRGVTAIEPSSNAMVMSSAATKASSPFGPFIFTVWPSTDAVTPFGTGTGFFPIRDIDLLFSFHFAADQKIVQRTSPPRLRSRASASDMTPCGVDTMETPSPLL